MTPQDLARLHARCFTRPRPWTETEFTHLLEDRHVFLLEAPDGFLLGRALAGEAELLTLAVAPEARRQGLARDLLTRFEAEARARDAFDGFLEVAVGNAPARALYAAHGWTVNGRRRDYYRHPDGTREDAEIMGKHLA